MNPIELPASKTRGLRVRDLGVPYRSIVEYRCELCITTPVTTAGTKQVPLLATVYLTDLGNYVEAWREVESNLGNLVPKHLWTLWPMDQVGEDFVALCGRHPDRRFELGRSRILRDVSLYAGAVHPGGRAKAKSIAVQPA